MLSNIIKKAKSRAQAADAFYLKMHKTDIGFEGWKLKTSSVRQKEGYGLRVLKDGKIGFAASTDPNGLDDMIDNAMETAKFGEEVEIALPGPHETESPDIYDPAIIDLSIEDIIGFGKKFIELCSSYRDTCDLSFEAQKVVLTQRIINSSGFDREFSKTYLVWSGNLNRVKQEDVFMLYDGSASTYLPDMDAELKKMVEPFAEKLRLADSIYDIDSGKKPILFHPKGTMVIILPLMAAINGRSVYSNTSPLVGKEEHKIFDEKLSVCDDGTINRMIGSAPFDDEGLPKEKLDIVRDGVFKNFLFDLVTAKKAGRKSNGCANRGIFSSPNPGTSNIIIDKGEELAEDMISSIDDGLLIEGVLGMGQGNIISGTFSNPLATAFKIENGEKVGRVKDATISGNIYQDLKEITAISNTQELVWGSYLCPWIRVDNLNVAGK